MEGQGKAVEGQEKAVERAVEMRRWKANKKQGVAHATARDVPLPPPKALKVSSEERRGEGERGGERIEKRRGRGEERRGERGGEGRRGEERREREAGTLI